jgi:acetyltransferase-like isoleucine patch superfamily enzyme
MLGGWHARVVGRICSGWWRTRLRWDARRSGGRVEISPTVRFRVRVKFRGRGTVRIEHHAILGDADAGLPDAPIFLAPRGPESWISIGERSRLANGVELIAIEGIELGEGCLLGAGVRMIDSDFHGVAPERRSSGGLTGPVRAGKRVWIGMGAIILKGVRIGNDAVVGAGAVVARDVPEGGLTAGNRGRVILLGSAAGESGEGR